MRLLVIRLVQEFGLANVVDGPDQLVLAVGLMSLEELLTAVEAIFDLAALGIDARIQRRYEIAVLEIAILSALFFEPWSAVDVYKLESVVLDGWNLFHIRFLTNFFVLRVFLDLGVCAFFDLYFLCFELFRVYFQIFGHILAIWRILTGLGVAVFCLTVGDQINKLKLLFLNFNLAFFDKRTRIVQELFNASLLGGLRRLLLLVGTAHCTIL